jgi:hypothetical protein
MSSYFVHLFKHGKIFASIVGWFFAKLVNFQTAIVVVIVKLFNFADGFKGGFRRDDGNHAKIGN